MKWTLLSNENRIENIIISDDISLFGDGLNILPYGGGKIGDYYINGVVIPSELPLSNYTTVRADRLKVALYRNGVLTQVSQAIDNIGGELKIWWDNAMSFDLNDQRLLDALDLLNIDRSLAQKWFNDGNSIY